MSDKRKKPNNPDRLSNGYFAKGNKIGRMQKRGYRLSDLTKVAMEYDKTHDDSILRHYIERLHQSDKLLDKFIDRYVPIKTIQELTGLDGSPLTIVVEKSYEPKKQDLKNKTNL